MPLRAKRPCLGRCGALVDKGFCLACAQRGRGAKVRQTASQRGYTSKWSRHSKARLARHPFCVDPYGTHGERDVLAQVTDHITPHRGNQRLFWDPKNHQSLCKCCHDRKTATEDGGFGH